MEKLFVVRKYVKANSAKQAILREKNQPVDDVWIDEDWKKANIENPSGKEMGFKK